MAFNFSNLASSLGGSLVAWSAQKAKDEYWQEEKEIAASAASAKRFEFLYEELGKEARNLNDALSRTGPFGGMGELDAGTKKAFEAQLKAINNLRGTMFGVLSGVSPSSTISEDVISDIMEQIRKAQQLHGASTEDKVPEDAKYKGDPYKTPPGSIDESQALRDKRARLVEQADKFWGSSIGQLILKKGADIIKWAISMRDPEEQEAYAEAVKKYTTDSTGLPGTGYYGTPPTQGEGLEEPAGLPGTGYYGTPPVQGQAFEQGLIEQGARYTEQDTAQETPGGGISEEPLLESETVDGIPQTGIGSEAALRSLYEDVGGPIGEPTGNVVYPTNLPAESEEIETKKTSLNRTLGALVKYAESNVNGYNAVAGSDEGDANLTNMTLREIREKYGNTAVGVGQFKYNEFIKPTADKYMNIDEDTLLSTVFSRDFQEQLLTLGLEDAGMTLFLKGRIDEETFMKRLWNIFRGLAPKKESLPGEVTDEYGNKVNVGGGLISQALERY